MKYEVGLCIRTGEIVWIYGGFPAGEVNDLGLASKLFLTKLNRGEKVIGDLGYNHYKFITPHTHPQTARLQKNIRSRHETVNSRLKAFKVLSTPFRHDISKHLLCFYAVAKIVQMSIITDEPLYQLQ